MLFVSWWQFGSCWTLWYYLCNLALGSFHLSQSSSLWLKKKKKKATQQKNQKQKKTSKNSPINPNPTASISTKCCGNYACPKGGKVVQWTQLACIALSTSLGTGVIGLRKGRKLKENKKGTVV